VGDEKYMHILVGILSKIFVKQWLPVLRENITLLHPKPDTDQPGIELDTYHRAPRHLTTVYCAALFTLVDVYCMLPFATKMTGTSVRLFMTSNGKALTKPIRLETIFHSQ
jgi:hypothetical protein